MPESYGTDCDRWLRAHPGWRFLPLAHFPARYWAWRPDRQAQPVWADTLDDLASLAARGSHA
jgi:hypothetical protein